MERRASPCRLPRPQTNMSSRRVLQGETGIIMPSGDPCSQLIIVAVRGDALIAVDHQVIIIAPHPRSRSPSSTIVDDECESSPAQRACILR